MIDANMVAAVTLDGVPLAPGSLGYSAATKLPKALASGGVAAGADWVGIHVLRLTLRDGSTLWLQAMPDATGARLRVTADAPANSGPRVQARTRAIRSLRLLAYHLPASAIGPIIAREFVGRNGVAVESAVPTVLSTRTKQD